MRYESGAAFRQALEDRLRLQSKQTGLPLVRLRKLVAFERLLARLQADQPGRWLLKGGLALQWRIASLARTTKDLDLSPRVLPADLYQTLRDATLKDLADWFAFFVRRPAHLEAPNGGGLRFAVNCLLDSRPFEAFHVDVGWGDPLIDAPESIPAPPLLEFAGLPPTAMLCYPISQHLAEKVHAYSRPHPGSANTRAKDLLDILLLGRAGTITTDALSRALEATFATRQTHPMPDSLPDPPKSWEIPYRKMAGEVGLAVEELGAAMLLARRFLDPVLRNEVRGIWDPAEWRWQERGSLR